MTPDEIRVALQAHEREDSGRFGEVMRELGGISATQAAFKEDLTEIKQALRNLDARQWEDHPSQAKTPTGSRASAGLSAKAIVGLVAAVTVLANALAQVVASALHG